MLDRLGIWFPSCARTSVMNSAYISLLTFIIALWGQHYYFCSTEAKQGTERPPNRATSGSYFHAGADGTIGDIVFLPESRNLDYPTGARSIVRSCPVDVESWSKVAANRDDIGEREREREYPGFPFLPYSNFQLVFPIGWTYSESRRKRSLGKWVIYRKEER